MNMPTHALEINQLVAGYPGCTVLHGLDLRVERGEWLGLLGANGSGKTTLLDCIASRRKPDSGRILIDDHALEDGVLARHRLGYAVAPESLPTLLSGRECLAVHATAKHLPCVEEELLELAKALGLSRWLDDPVAMYSLGTRQKLGVLLALVGEPALVVLDESFNGLDPASSLVLKHHLRGRADAGRCAILLATHGLDLVERYCDSAVLLDEGRLVGSWQRDDLRRFDQGTDDGLERALARVLAAASCADQASA